MVCWLVTTVFIISGLCLNQITALTSKKFDFVDLLVVTVATDPKNDGLKRLSSSAKKFGLKLQVFGTDEEWKGGDLKNYEV